MSLLTQKKQLEKERKGTKKEKSFICRLWKKERAEEDGGEASVLTVKVMSLKGSIIAARAYKRKKGGGQGGGRGDGESAIITEGEGTWRIQMISRQEINQAQSEGENGRKGRAASSVNR